MTTTDAIRELMATWNRIMDAARAQFPGATEEELYHITAGAMTRALGIKEVSR